MYIQRLLEAKINSTLKRGKSVLLLGPRQTGKTTLIDRIPAQKRITLANPFDRIRYEKEPFLLTAEVEKLAIEKSSIRKQSKHPLVMIDEIQKLPLLMDAVQDLIDRKVAMFILTGSSARKLCRRGHVNLLPGRVIPLRLDPLNQEEIPSSYQSLNNLLLYGSLPEIVLQKNKYECENLLEAYVTIYLEEEIRAEAIVRDIGHFARFLELAASESGKIVNFTKLSQEIGITHSTIASYYQILEDCLVAERIEPLIMSKTRRKLTKSQKYLFYDLGVRRVAAREGDRLSREQLGHLFEHYVGLELIRFIRLSQYRYRLKYWRDQNGPEVDWVIETGDHYIPIEVKWTQMPALSDAKHLQIFLREYPQAKNGYIICQTPHAMKLNKNIYALPWDQLSEVFK
ncbi:MAG TPA: ATP-binding protein [Gammaproteobacteria bacterium]|nr:ATP-binding protein [Gammaproteobacteria bacterium]